MEKKFMPDEERLLGTKMETKQMPDKRLPFPAKLEKKLKFDEHRLLNDERLRGRDASVILNRSDKMQRFTFFLGVVAGLFASFVFLIVFYALFYQPLKSPFNTVPVTTGFVDAGSPTLQVHLELQGSDLDSPDSPDTPVIDDISMLKFRWSETVLKNIFRYDHRQSTTNADYKKTETVSSKTKGETCTANESNRFDCWPEAQGATEKKCQARGCCWNSSPSVNGVPFCFYPDNYISYAVSQSLSENSESGLSATLVRKNASPFPNDVLQLQIDVTYETRNRLRVKIFDPKNQRYEVPLNLSKSASALDDIDYVVSLQMSPFGILVTRKSNGAIIFDSRDMAPLVFADQFLQLGTRLSSPNIYGLGEHRHALRLDSNWTRLVLWTRDQAPSGGGNLYGAHPFFLNLEEDGQAHGVFLLNSNAIEVVLQPYANGKGSVTYHALGGVLDFYIFTGPSSLAVIEQYVSLIGKPAMPPFWSLGFHLCKYGYMNTSELRKVIESNRALNIPYDVQWNDIDYMDRFLDWTYDANGSYAGLRDVVDDLHAHDQRYVVIIDPGISTVQTPGTYPPFDQGKEMDIFIKNASGDILVGQVWPGSTAFPDFFHPRAEEYWFNQMQSYHSKMPFDGLWIDMNEPSNFVDGSVTGCTDGPLDNPPFSPPSVNGGKLISRTVCPSAKQAISTHYNLHNMYGWSETKATSNGLKKLLNKRSFVLSRSSFPSSGHYGSHWLGDNRSEWPDLYYSVPGILNFNMFGVPMVGADVCGFGGNTNRELCIRWMQLGAFYPFMRNHDSLMSKPQDPAQFDSEAVSYMRNVLYLRYSLLAYMYTQFYKSHISGTPVVRPLFMLFNNTETIDRQFMWGNELLISPVLDEGATTVNAYIPEGRWYNIYEPLPLDMKKGAFQELQALLSEIIVHIHGGSILPIMHANVTTNAMRRQPFALVVAPDQDMAAFGQLYWDDGESLDSVESQQYTLVEFQLRGSTVKSNVVLGNYPASLDQWTIMGVNSEPTTVSLNGQSVHFDYSQATQMLLLTGTTVDLRTPFTLTWS